MLRSTRARMDQFDADVHILTVNGDGLGATIGKGRGLRTYVHGSYSLVLYLMAERRQSMESLRIFSELQDFAGEFIFFLEGDAYLANPSRAQIEWCMAGTQAQFIIYLRPEA